MTRIGSWRRWTTTHRALGIAYRLGIISGYSRELDDIAWVSGRWAVGAISVTGRRPYLLGVSRDTWRCWLRGHRRAEPAGLGLCTRCVPWACCGSTTAGHIAGCEQNDQPAVAL